MKARAASTTDTKINIVKWEEGDITDWFRISSNSLSVTVKFLRSAMCVLRLFDWSSRCPAVWSSSEGRVNGSRSHSNCSGSGVILILLSAVSV